MLLLLLFLLNKTKITDVRKKEERGRRKKGFCQGREKGKYNGRMGETKNERKENKENVAFLFEIIYSFQHFLL